MVVVVGVLLLMDVGVVVVVGVVDADVVGVDKQMMSTQLHPTTTPRP